jgi:hypothetical protein
MPTILEHTLLEVMVENKRAMDVSRSVEVDLR